MDNAVYNLRERVDELERRVDELDELLEKKLVLIEQLIDALKTMGIPCKTWKQ